MRLYAFLLVTVAALHARAATIPVSETYKLIEIVPENTDKAPENTSSEQELIDQANIIKDVENNLRVKLEDIPVKVIVEDAQPALKTEDGKDESKEIIRPVPDLRNPGPPQRQEHETQNPEYYASEQLTVVNFKQSLSEAQDVFRQGLQGINDGIKNMLENNEQIQTIQERIQSLREGFSTQINKLNGTIQNYLNTESSSINQPNEEQTKANFLQVEKGLQTLKNDFNRGLKTLSNGVEVAATLKAENSNESNPSSTSTPPAQNPFQQLLQNNPFQQLIESFNKTIQDVTNSFSNAMPNWTVPNIFTLPTQAPAQVQNEEPTATTAAPTRPNLIQNFQNFLNTSLPQNPFSGPINQVISWFNNPGSQAPQGSPSAQPVVAAQPTPTAKPEPPAQPTPIETEPSETSKPESKPEAQAAKAPETTAATPTGPILQILQNNPIRKGITEAVQRLQNINNPEKPKEIEKPEEQKIEEEEAKTQDEDKSDGDSKKGGYFRPGGGQNPGDNNDSSVRVEESDALKNQNEKLPEVQKPKEDEIKEHKTDEVVDKTE